MAKSIYCDSAMPKIIGQTMHFLLTVDQLDTHGKVSRGTVLEVVMPIEAAQEAMRAMAREIETMETPPNVVNMAG